jgi:hypothetical protein
MVRLQGKLIAPRARQWLVSASEPRLHSLYRQSVNLFDPTNGLLSVVLPSLGPGPFAIVAAPAEDSFKGFQSLEIQSPITIRADQLQIGDIQIELSGALEWEPRPDWTKLDNFLDEPQVSRMNDLLGQHAPTGSFAPLVDGFEVETDQTFHSEVLRAAAEPARRLKASLANGNTSGAVKAAERLAGLGGGVTPSGDDYLQGAIHALWSRLTDERARSLSEAVVSAAAPRTNAISGAWLKAAAVGEAGDDWHGLEQALGTDRELEQAITQLIQRGHTSGADALAGFVATLPVLR